MENDDHASVTLLPTSQESEDAQLRAAILQSLGEDIPDELIDIIDNELALMGIPSGVDSPVGYISRSRTNSYSASGTNSQSADSSQTSSTPISTPSATVSQTISVPASSSSSPPTTADNTPNTSYTWSDMGSPSQVCSY